MHAADIVILNTRLWLMRFRKILLQDNVKSVADIIMIDVRILIYKILLLRLMSLIVCAINYVIRFEFRMTTINNLCHTTVMIL